MLTTTIPALPTNDVGAAVVFYRDRLGFEPVHETPEFAVIRRDEAELHLWLANDDGWLGRPAWNDREGCRVSIRGLPGT